MMSEIEAALVDMVAAFCIEKPFRVGLEKRTAAQMSLGMMSADQRLAKTLVVETLDDRELASVFVAQFDIARRYAASSPEELASDLRSYRLLAEAARAGVLTFDAFSFIQKVCAAKQGTAAP